MTVDAAEHKGRPMLVVAGAFSLAWIAEAVVYGAGVYLGILGFFGLPLMWLGFLIVLVISIAHSAVRRSLPTGRRYGPLLMQLLAIWLTWGLGLERLVTHLNFRVREQARMEVIELAKNKKLTPTYGAATEGFYLAYLPTHLRHLSSGGVVRVAYHAQGISVIFFVKRHGMFDDDNYTGLVYRSGDGMPQAEVDDNNRFTLVEEWAPHWFFVWHT